MGNGKVGNNIPVAKWLGQGWRANGMMKVWTGRNTLCKHLGKAHRGLAISASADKGAEEEEEKNKYLKVRDPSGILPPQMLHWKKYKCQQKKMFFTLFPFQTSTCQLRLGFTSIAGVLLRQRWYKGVCVGSGDPVTGQGPGSPSQHLTAT